MVMQPSRSSVTVIQSQQDNGNERQECGQQTMEQIAERLR